MDLVLHVTTQNYWRDNQDKPYYVSNGYSIDGFIHCSTIEYFWRVAPNFTKVTDELCILVIDLKKLEARVCFEDLDNLGREYPHIYGLINRDAIVNVLPYYKDKTGLWIKNPEFKMILNK